MFSGYFAMGLDSDPTGRYTLRDAAGHAALGKCGVTLKEVRIKGLSSNKCVKTEYDRLMTSSAAADKKKIFTYWYNLEKSGGKDWMKGLPDCPCYLQRCIPMRTLDYCLNPEGWQPLDGDPAQWSIVVSVPETMKSLGLSDYYHPGSDIDMRSVPNKHGARQQCTYKKVGVVDMKLSGTSRTVTVDLARLITDGEAVNTADRGSSHELGGFNYDISHEGQDLAPFDLAYELDGGAGVFGKYTAMYIEVRPPNRGVRCKEMVVDRPKRAVGKGN